MVFRAATERALRPTPAYVCQLHLFSRHDGAADTAQEPSIRWNSARLVAAGMAVLESAAGLRFGCARRPFFASVRSGAAASVPGMLETVLDVGVNDATVNGFLRLTGNPRLAWDRYRRLVQCYAEVFLQRPGRPFNELVTQSLIQADVETEGELDFLVASTDARHACVHRRLWNTIPHRPIRAACAGGHCCFPFMGSAQSRPHTRVKRT